MSLRTIADRVADYWGYEITKNPSEGRTALCLVLNRSFLPGLKVLVYSLIRKSSLIDIPVVILSEDAGLKEEPIVAEIADRFIVAGEDDIAQFSGIKSERVDERVRLDWIAKYTLLKWLIFEDLGYDRHIFIDADIVCLREVNDLLSMSTADLYGSATGYKLFEDADGTMVGPDEREHRLQAYIKMEDARSSLNTGVLVINKNLLSSDFRRKLIVEAENSRFDVEQRVVNSVISAEGYLRERISPLYNFNAGLLRKASVASQIGLLNDIHLLHYVGANGKPWEVDLKPNSALHLRIWHMLAAEARATDKVFK